MQPVISDATNLTAERHLDGEQQGTTSAPDSDTVIRQGASDIEVEGNDLGRAASGEVASADLDTARQRLRDCQGALISLGYQLGGQQDPGEGITGIMDDATIEAVKQFQDDQGLDIDGVITGETYESLLSNFEQALSMRAHSQQGDDFMPMHTDEATTTGSFGADRGNNDADLEALSADDSALLADAGGLASDDDDLSPALEDL